MFRGHVRRSGSKRGVWHAREKKRRRNDPTAAPNPAPAPVVRPRYVPTEAQWLSGEPDAMLRCLTSLATEYGSTFHLPRAAIVRKLRLFHCACCRLRWNLLPAIGRGAVEVIERYADGLVAAKQLRGARRTAEAAVRAVSPNWQTAGQPGAWDATGVARLAVHAAEVHATLRLGRAASGAPVSAPEQAGLLRELFGNLFRPVRVEPVWLTPTVVALAHCIRKQSSFEVLPVLGDALQDAGCSEPEVLDHCYRPGTHVRGCWLLDQLTGWVVDQRLPTTRAIAR